MSGFPIVIVESGGLPVTEVENGTPYEIADNGYGTPVTFVASGGLPLTQGVSFNLDAFMAAQADGLYFDTTKTDRFFQENTGPTLADDVGEAMGLALSQRAWNGQTLAQVLAGQSEKSANPGPFTATTGFTATNATLTISSGAIRITSGPGGFAARADYQALATEVGKTYRVRVRNVATSNVSVLPGYRVGTSAGGTQLVPSTSFAIGGTVDVFFTATTTTSYVSMVGSPTDGAWAEFDLLSVKEVPGKHGIQATGTLKPTRQTAGAKFDGSDDNWLTTYTAGAGENFIVALVDVPASLSANQYFFGSYKASGALRFHLGFDPTGLVRYGLGTASAAVGGDRRGTTSVVGMSTDGSTFRVFDEDAEASSGAMSGVVADVACRLGALNFDGTASSFFAGSIKKLVAGRQFLDLATYRKIRNALLAA